MRAEVDITYLGEGVYDAKLKGTSPHAAFAYHHRGDIDRVVTEVAQRLKKEAELCPVTGD